ncbi:MAG TPA: hypothetical protein VMA98_12415 [Candidatus Acidoferrales bacterium]|nr:hypothetical protein [Candidatus Acidoferrales bacterium]
MTPLVSRRLQLGAFAVCWLVAAGLQVYASDVGSHGAQVGAYVPGWLLAVAAIPWWAFLAPALVDGIAALAGASLTPPVVRVLMLLNATGLVAYAFVSVATIFYVAFSGNGIS